MASQCPAHNHFHFNSELVFLEVLNGAPSLRAG